MRAYKHKPPKPRPANKTSRKLERASHDGFKLAHHEGEWGFVEGGNRNGKTPKHILTHAESRAIEEAFKRKCKKKLTKPDPVAD